MGRSETSSTTVQNPTDPEASRRMAAVAERQQQMAEEQWGLARDIYLPYEQQMVESNQRLVGENENLMRARMVEGARDIELDRPLRDTMRTQRVEELNASAPLVSRFYEEAGNGVDVNQRMSQAEADVVGAYADVPESVRRNMSRTGASLSGGKYADLMKAIALDRARSIAGAQGTARRAAETEGFERLRSAMAARSGISPSLDNTAYAQGNEQLGNYTLTSPIASAVGLYGNVTSANEAGMRGLTSTRSSGLSVNF